jgi:hypothetical protein
VQPSDCVTFKCRPAIVSVPARGAPVVAATVNGTAADPLPLALPAIEIHSASELAVHVQSGLDARRSAVPLPPVCGNEAELLPSSYLHSPAAWVICARRPLTITPPVRATGSLFDDALNWTEPSPCPVAPAVMLSQDTSG